jgi:hypothetical protein
MAQNTSGRDLRCAVTEDGGHCTCQASKVLNFSFSEKQFLKKQKSQFFNNSCS